MEIKSRNVTIPLHTSVHLTGDSIEVSVGMGDTEETLTIVSLDSLLREYLDMHEFFTGGGYAPELLEGLLQLRKLVDYYIRKVKASPEGSAASRTRGSRPYARGK